MIISTGDKGGAGKTMTARMIGEVLHSAGLAPHFIDCDMANSDTLATFSEQGCPVSSIDVRDPGAIDRLMQAVFDADDNAIFVLDMPAGAGEYLAKEAEMFQMLVAEKENLTLDIVWTLNIDQRGIDQLGDTLAAFDGIPANFTVVKNHYHAQDDNRPDPFTLWHSAPIRKKLQKAGNLTESELPNIRVQVLHGLGNNPIHKALNKEIEMDFMTRARWSGLFKQIKGNFSHLIAAETEAENSEAE